MVSIQTQRSRAHLDTLERELGACVSHWKFIDETYSDSLKFLGNSAERKYAVKLLLKADRTMKKLAPVLRLFKEVPGVTLLREPPEGLHHIKATDFLAAGGLKWVANWIKSRRSDRPGRKLRNVFAIRCAEDLVEIFQKRTDRQQWQRVAELIAQHFPSAVPEGGGANWIQNLVKDHRPRRKKMLDEAMQKKRKIPEGDFLPEKTPQRLTIQQAFVTIQGIQNRAKAIDSAGITYNQRIKTKRKIRKPARHPANVISRTQS